MHRGERALGSARRAGAVGLVATLIGGALAAVLWLRPSRPATAGEVVSAVESFLGAHPTLSTRFEQHFWMRVYERTVSSRGRLTIQRPGRIRLDYDGPDGLVFVGDGTQWATHWPFEGSGGDFARGTGDAPFSSSFAVLTGAARLDAFHASLRPPRADDPPDRDVLVLVPIEPTRYCRSLVLYVDRRASSRGMVRAMSIEDADGNWSRFFFEAPELDVRPPPGLFQLAPPPGARELRVRS